MKSIPSALVFALFLGGCASEKMPPAGSAFVIPDFYSRRTAAEGVPVLAEAAVSPKAVAEAARIASAMLADAPAAKEALLRANVRIVVIARARFTTDLPEMRDARPRQYHDIFGRCAAATPERPLITVGEENLLGYAGDPQAGNNALVGAIAGSVLALPGKDDGAFLPKLKQAREAALKRRPASDDSPLPSLESYWITGVSARFSATPDTDAALLKRLDPELGALVAATFGETVRELRAAGPADSPGAPVFTRPAEFKAWADRYRRGVETLAPTFATIIPAMPPKLHPSLRPGYIREWKSPAVPGAAARVWFVNASEAPVRIDEIGPEGASRRTVDLVQGDHSEPRTTAGTVWRVSDGITKKIIGYVMPPAGDSLRVFRSVEDEDADFDEDGELDSYIPYRMDLRPASQRAGWASDERTRDAVLRVVNDSGRAIRLESLDRAGEATSFGTLRRGDSVTIDTFANQAWRVTEADGATLGYLVTSYKPGAFTFTDLIKPAP